MADDLPFKAEYAKSGRAACEGCKLTIAKGSPKTMVQRILKTAEELVEEEKKQKREETKKIHQAANERRLKRLCEAESLQRILNEVEVRQMELCEKRILLRRRGRKPYIWYLTQEEEWQLLMDWFQLEKDRDVLSRFKSELVNRADSIQLEDRQARLENDIRALLTSENPRTDDHERIQVLTKELVDTVEERNNLVETLEEDRLRELEYDKKFDEIITAKAKEYGMDKLR